MYDNRKIAGQRVARPDSTVRDIELTLQRVYQFLILLEIFFLFV